jgi:hypothetical protein
VDADHDTVLAEAGSYLGGGAEGGPQRGPDDVCLDVCSTHLKSVGFFQCRGDDLRVGVILSEAIDVVLSGRQKP